MGVIFPQKSVTLHVQKHQLWLQLARLMGLDLLPDAQSPSSSPSCISTPYSERRIRRTETRSSSLLASGDKSMAGGDSSCTSPSGKTSEA
ncbi:hypothetical protein K1719_035480 [Acacia pycnantha]|nr:hypothetical protein K1719_035480 [Acacia pycnantha]